jgi:hypothetical protein
LRVIARPHRIAQEQGEQQAVEHADAAEEFEPVAPAERFGDVPADPAERGARVNARHVQPGRQRSRPPAVVVSDQREGGGDVARFAHTHQRAGGEELMERRGPTAGERGDRPEEQAGEDDPAAADAVGDVPAQGAHGRVNPQENRREQSELRVGNVNLGADRVAHRGDHQAVEVVE